MDDRVAISLLRHGLTAENEKSAYIGWTNSPLSSTGRKSIQPIVEPELLFSSDLMRCLETVALLFPYKEALRMEEFREMYFGNWEGKTYEQLKSVKSYQDWIEDPFSRCPDGGESFAEFGLRIQTGWEKVKKQILQADTANVAIVAHGGVIRYLLSLFAPQKKSFFEWKIPYGGGYQLIFTRDGLRRGEKCISLQAVPTTENQHGQKNFIN
jgi:alpha-ribazole phosphatase